MNLEGIEGLTALDSGTQYNPLAGSKFALPPGFDTKRWASKWVEEGPQVTEAQQPTILQSAGVQAAGWQVYKQAKFPTPTPKKEGDPELNLDDTKRKVPILEKVTRAAGKVIYVLMVRPKQLQQVVNVIHANESRTLVSREVAGETNASNVNNDHGIVTATNKKVFREEDTEGYLKTTPLNQTPTQAVELNLA